MLREDFEKMGFNLELPSMEDKLRGMDLQIRHNEFTKDEMEAFVYLTMMYKQDGLEAIMNEPEWKDEFLVKIINKKMEMFPDVFDPAIFCIALMSYGVDNPGKVNIFIIKCLEHHLKNGKRITPDILSMEIFPFGFYDDDTGRNLVNECLKPKPAISLFAELY